MSEKKCPKCKSILSLKNGKNGPFWGCSKYPDCDYTNSAKRADPKITEEVATIAVRRLGLAFTFIQECGGVQAAMDAIKAAEIMTQSSKVQDKEDE